MLAAPILLLPRALTCPSRLHAALARRRASPAPAPAPAPSQFVCAQGEYALENYTQVKAVYQSLDSNQPWI